MPKLTSVPCVDLQEFTLGTPKEAASFTARFGQGLKEFGFVVVEGHAIEPVLIKDAYAKVKAVFEQPASVKATFDLPGGGG